MSGIWILLLLILTAALPAIAVFFWFRAKTPRITLPWYLVSFAAGIVSLLAAALAQNIFPVPGGDRLSGFGQILFGVFIRVALVEELSRLVILIPVFRMGRNRAGMDRSFCAALGLAAGLGFAAMENAFYGTAGIDIALLRVFTAAPLNGACGIRAGAAGFLLAKEPLKAAFIFVSAVLIHAAYNLMIVVPFLPSALAVPVALAAFLSSLSFIADGFTQRPPLG